MAWTIELTDAAFGQLEQLDRDMARRIRKFLHKRIAPMENPRTIGQALQGQLRQYWKYRVGNYRLIVDIVDDRLVILVVRIGHRREIYR